MPRKVIKLALAHYFLTRIRGVQPNKLENLDALLAQAELYANHSMRNIGRLPATLCLIGSEGHLMFMPDSLADEEAKDDFATNARLLCISLCRHFRRHGAGSLGQVREVRRIVRRNGATV